MILDLKNPLHIEQFKARCALLLKREAIVDLTEKKPQRTRSQNNYLHLLLGYLAMETGNTLEWVKQKYYKAMVNPSLYIREKEDPYMGAVKYLRSSRDLTTDEMTTSIERLRNWAAEAAGIYLPSADEHNLLQTIDNEIQNNKRWI